MKRLSWIILYTVIGALSAGRLQAQGNPYGAQYGLYDLPEDMTAVEVGWTPRQQFLLRPNTAMEYTNFGWRRYRERGAGFGFLPVYDQFGEPWLSGAITAFSWVEERGRAPEYGSELIRDYARHNYVVIARENFSNGALRLTVGDAIRTSFTSLTLDISRFSGLRLDGVVGQNHEFTFLSTRPSDPRQRTRFIYQGTALRDQGTILGAGHWQGRFLQGAVHLGATLINHHRFDSQQNDGSFLLGTMARELRPDSVMVRISNDSPGISHSSSVHGAKVQLSLGWDDDELWVVPGVAPVLWATPGARFEEGYWQIDGDEYVEYTVATPENTLGFRAQPVVSGDYSIGTRQVHRALDRVSVQQRIRQTPLRTRARAAGAGAAEPVLVTLEHGLSSAMNVAGFNGRIALRNLDMEWEYVRTFVHKQYPVPQIGVRSSYSGPAYFLRGTHDWRWLTAGGEYFSISPKFDSYAIDNGDFRQGQQFFTGGRDYITAPFQGNHLGFYFNEPQPNPLQAGNDRRDLVYALVEDNDDDDQYPDQGQDDAPRRTRTQPVYSGVYPGWDVNQDGVPDWNRNRSQIPDYREPFLRYWQEEQVFYWGQDFNNNGVLDRFEDDSLPNYPYYKDEQGYHGFVLISAPVPGLSFRVGRYRIDQIAGAGRNHVDYCGASYRRVFPGRGRVLFEHEIKRVKDDIPNHIFHYRLADGAIRGVEGTYESVFVEDRLSMRNSVVNRGYLGTHWVPVRGMNVINNLRYELNAQQEAEFSDGSVQQNRSLNTWALVNKADYAVSWRRLTLRPMVKHTLLKQDQDSGTGPGGITSRRDETEFIPIFRADYRFTGRTMLELGAEGFPFLETKYIDRDDPSRDYDAQTYLGQIKRTGVSGGFDAFIVAGMQYTRKRYHDERVPAERYVRSFFQVFIGEQILAGAQ